MAHRSIPPPVPPPIAPAIDSPPLANRHLDHPPDRWRTSIGQARDRPVAALGAAACFLLLLAVGWWLLRPAVPPAEATLPLASANTAESTAGATPSSVSTSTTAVPDVVVQAAGAVDRPGLYRLAPGTRVDDLIREAGGLTTQADRTRINLATLLVDGERIWIPERGQADVPEVVTGTGGSGASTGATGPAESAPNGVPGAVVDLNQASVVELETLPGVGPVTAATIVSHREQAGPFAAVEDLLDVRGIGEAKLEQIRPFVQV